MTPDADLLSRFAATNSEAAFAELVQRHVNLVYSAALRQVNGDAHLAQDVAQTVFTDLARKAGSLANRDSLTGWLYTSAHFAAAKIIRGEHRRRDREEKFMREPIAETAPELDWEQLRPTLDDAMHELKEADREAILLRYFENRPFAEVGAKLGLNENAARMRVERALEKLRAALTQRGVTTAAALATALSANAVQLAPASLAATLTTAAIATAGTGTFTFIKIMTMTKIKLALSALVVAGAATALVVQQQAQTKLGAENQSLRAQMTQLQSDNESLSNRVATSSKSESLPKEQFNELLKLRGEVGVLRRQVKEFTQAEQARSLQEHEAKQVMAATQAELELARAKAQFKADEIKTVNNEKQISLAFRIFAGDNQDRFPTNVNQVDVSYFGSTNLMQFAQEQVEYVNTAVPNLIAYPQAILMREKVPRQDFDGKWRRVYGLADGSVQTAASDDGNFDAWEKQNTDAIPPAQ